MIVLRVCIGRTCHINGVQNVAVTFQHMIEEYNLHDKVQVKEAFCMSTCNKQGVSVSINDEKYRIDAGSARSFFREKVLPLVEA